MLAVFTDKLSSYLDEKEVAKIFIKPLVDCGV